MGFYRVICIISLCTLWKPIQICFARCKRRQSSREI